MTQGDVLLHDSRNALAISENRLIACVGVDNLLVETADAILVVHKKKTQDVKKILDPLKATRRTEGKIHRKVFRPWSRYDSVDTFHRLQVKRIGVKPGRTLSLQMHHHRAEHRIVVSGTARITKGDETILLSENQSAYIRLGAVHRLETPRPYRPENGGNAVEQLPGRRRHCAHGECMRVFKDLSVADAAASAAFKG